MAIVDETGRIIKQNDSFKNETTLKGEELFQTLLRPNACNRLYDSILFKSLRYPVGRLYEDVFTYHRILAQIDCMVMTGTVTYFYLQRQDSIMNTDYNVRFTDIVDAVYDRAKWLDSIGQKKLANETKLFVYSQTAVAFAHLDKNDPQKLSRLNEIMQIYKDCYPDLIKDDSISVKQKVKLSVLYTLPSLHTLLWGKKMPINLGG